MPMLLTYFSHKNDSVLIKYFETTGTVKNAVLLYTHIVGCANNKN